MKIVFVSNYLSHHQKPFCDVMYERTNHNYYFIETEPMKKERSALGWEHQEAPVYVINNYENDENDEYCKKLIDEADVVIIGSAPIEKVKSRLKKKKLTFLYSERLYKKGDKFYKYPKRLISMYHKFGRYENFYLLCASAYARADYERTFTFKDKAFVWGYFPEIKKYESIEDVVSQKEENSIIWAGRFIDWKHPEVPVCIAERLKEDGYSFKLRMIGTGEIEKEIQQLIEQKNLHEYVEMVGAVKPEKVRSAMEEAEVFLFTSDFNEGWGAVLNEAMNSGCACVASHAVGSAPFLIKDGENGFLYENGNLDDLYKKVKILLDNAQQRKSMGEKAYKTISVGWNADFASDRLIKLFKTLMSKEPADNLYSYGVCSMAKKLPNNWYKSK